MRMNIYTFAIFTNYCIAMEDIDEVDRIGFYLHHVEVGPLNLPELSHLKIVKEAIWNISSYQYLQIGGQDYHHGKTTLEFCEQELNFQYTQ